jgi:hypothetical protein
MNINKEHILAKCMKEQLRYYKNVVHRNHQIKIKIHIKVF